MWQWILGTVIVVVALIAAVFVIGLLLPKEHSAKRSAHYEQPAEVVWAAISDFGAHAAWRDGVESMEQLPDRDGHAVWREKHGRGDVIDMMVVESDPPRRMVTQIVGNRNFGGTWTWKIEPAGEKACTLTITEDGEIYNPVFRFVSRFLMGHRATMDGVHKALAAKFGQEVRFAADAD